MADKRVLAMYNKQPGQIAPGDYSLVGTGIKPSTTGVTLVIGDGATDVQIDVGAPGAPGVPSTNKLIVTADMDVNGIETVVGDTIFQSNIQLGDAPTDYITFVGRVGDPLNTNNDIVFEPVNPHRIMVAAPAAPGPGASLSIFSANANGANPAGSLTLDTGVPGTTAVIHLGTANAITLNVGQTAVSSTNLNGINSIGAVATDYTYLIGRINTSMQFEAGSTRIINIATPAAPGAGNDLTIASGSANGANSAGSLNLDTGIPGTTGTVAIGPVNATNIEMRTGGTLRLSFDNAGPPARITVHANTKLRTTGTGTISLPVNGLDGSTVYFQIGGAAVTSAAITAANFDKLFDGSNVTTHTHSGLAASGLVATNENSLSALTRGMAVRLCNNGGATAVDTQDATDDTAVNPILAFTYGLAKATIVAPGAVDVVTYGPCTTDDAAWDGGTPPTAAQIGRPVYGSTTTVGLLTLSPSDSTGYTTRIGQVYFGGGAADTSVVFVQPGEVVNNNPP